MNLNVRSQNSYFPLTSLPVVVINHIAQYLTSCDLGNMTKVDKYLREVFNSPQLWKDVCIRLPDKDIDPQSVEILRVREIRDLEIFNLNFELETKVLHPHLERLSLRAPTVETLKALTKAASSGQLKLRSLAFGRMGYKVASKVSFLELFKCLPMLEEVCFGHGLINIPLADDMKIDYPMISDLQEALCCTGKLLDISLKCFRHVARPWLKTVMLKNPNLQTLCLAGVEVFSEHFRGGRPRKNELYYWNFRGVQRLEDEAEGYSTVCSNLTSLRLPQSVPDSPRTSVHQRKLNKGTLEEVDEILSWAFPGSGAYENLTSLDMTGCHTSTLIELRPTFPGLQKLNLTDSYLVPTTGTERDLFTESWAHFPNLEWLELKGCQTKELPSIFVTAGKTLRYLGLAKHYRLTDNVLRDLPMWCPDLKTLDLSGCKRITDALLVEWYLKQNQSEWPKLRKLVMKGCEGVSQEMVDKVRMKERNQLLIEL